MRAKPSASPAGSGNARILAGSCALAFAAAWNIANLGPIADRLSSAYGVGLATVGLFTTTLFLGHLLVQVPGGRAIDALGARRVGLVSLGWIAACNGLLLTSPRPWLALFVRALAGLGTGAAFVAASDYARGAGTQLAQGLFGGASIGGSGLAVAIVPQLDGRLAWRSPYWTALVLAGAAALVLAGSPRGPGRRRARRLGAGLLSDRRLYRLGATHAATFGLSIVAGNWVVTLLSRGSGYGGGRAGAAGSLVLVAGLLTRPLGGILLRGRPAAARALIVWSLLAGALGTALLAAVSPIPLALAVPAALVVGLAAGLPFAPLFGGAQHLRTDAPGAAVGLVNAVALLVIVAGTPLTGLTFSLPGDGRIGFGILAALWALALLALPRQDDLL